ncbi:MAG: Gfo/Idh/MocA family oxidoreductase, partial [Gemmatimonadaceae bacterium]
RRRREARGDVEITAIADCCAARRRAARAIFPDARIYSSADSLLAAEADGLDFVDIATPPAAHAEIAMAALDAGVHVLCEKPLCTNVSDAEALLDRALHARRVLFPCHNYRHAPVIKAVREALDSGCIGRVHTVTLQTFRNTHARGVKEWKPDWRRDRVHAGGGIAMDHGSHAFYLIFDWMEGLPTSVSARACSGAVHDTEQDFNCTLGFPAGYATVHLTWTAGVRKVLYTLHGERGAIRVEDDMIEIAQMRPDPSRSYQGKWDFERRDITSEWMDSSHSSWFDSLFDEFRTAMDGENYVSEEALTACECIRVIEASYASAAQGSRVVGIERLESIPIEREVTVAQVRAVAHEVAPLDTASKVATAEWT